MLNPYGRRHRDSDDDWEDLPAEGIWTTLGGGICFPLVLAIGAMICLIVRDVVVPWRIYRWHVSEANAVALGLAGLSLALFLHCHYFWGTFYGNVVLVQLGKIVSMAAFISSAGYLIIGSIVCG